MSCQHVSIKTRSKRVSPWTLTNWLTSGFRLASGFCGIGAVSWGFLIVSVSSNFRSIWSWICFVSLINHWCRCFKLQSTRWLGDATLLNSQPFIPSYLDTSHYISSWSRSLVLRRHQAVVPKVPWYSVLPFVVLSCGQPWLWPFWMRTISWMVLIVPVNYGWRFTYASLIQLLCSMAMNNWKLKAFQV